MPTDDYTVDIQAGRPELVGVDPHYSGLVRIRLPLNPPADTDWIKIFNELPPGVSYTLDLHHPVASQRSIEGLTPDDRVESYVAHIRERVDGTNRFYNTDVASRLKQEADRRREAAAEQRRRLDDVRKKFENL